MEFGIEDGIRHIFQTYDGMVIGGNDFLYTKELDSHPCSYFLYRYGRLLREIGVDTIFLENHYYTEPIQTRGLIGHVMYAACILGMRVIGIEGKFTKKDYLTYFKKKVNSDRTTVAFSTKKRIDRLNIITKDIVESHKRNKYLLFCGMSHVNDELADTACPGIKTLLQACGMGASFCNKSVLTKGKPFVVDSGTYTRQTDFMLDIQLEKQYDSRLYTNAFTWCLLHDVLFFFKTYRDMCLYTNQPYSVSVLGKQHTSVFPPEFSAHLTWMMKTDPRLYVTEKERDHICSTVHSLIRGYENNIPLRPVIRTALSGITERDLRDWVTIWIEWVKGITKQETLDPYLLDLSSDLIFLEYKKLSTDRDEDRYVKYVKNKYSKQVDRPEHKMMTALQLLKLLGIFPHMVESTKSKQINGILTQLVE
jgi:hypothetical protein